MREVVLRGEARAYYDLMSDAERAQVDERLGYLEHDPSANGTTTFDIPDVPGVRLFDDGTWRLGYRVPDEATVVVFVLKHALDLPD